MRVRIRPVVVLLVVALPALAGWSSAQTVPAAALPRATAQTEEGSGSLPTVTVTEEMRSHQRWLDGLYFAGALYGLLVLAGVLVLGISRRLRDLAGRVTGRSFGKAMVYFALFSLVTTLLTLPLEWISGFWVPHRYALSGQGLGGWLWDQAKALAVGTAIGAPLAAVALTGIRRVKRWWLALWLGSVPVVLLLVVIGPVVVDPLFNDFKPLADRELRQELLALAERAGIEGGRVFEVDKSKQTTVMNAYVNGLGPTKRIVLWDTIIAKMDRSELKFVMAHEMAHYVLHHMWTTLAFLLGLFFFVFWAGQGAVEAATRRWGRAWGFEAPHDPAALPLLLLVVSLASFLLTPAINAFSRAQEHQADVFALDLTHLNLAGARAFVKLAEDSKVLPDPSPFIRFWRYSHPTLAERIAFCASYRPWERGGPDRVGQATPAS